MIIYAAFTHSSNAVDNRVAIFMISNPRKLEENQGFIYVLSSYKCTRLAESEEMKNDNDHDHDLQVTGFNQAYKSKDIKQFSFSCTETFQLMKQS